MKPNFSTFIFLALFAGAVADAKGQQIIGHTGPERGFGGRLSRPSQGQLKRIHEQAAKSLSLLSVEMPASQTHPGTASPSDLAFSWKKAKDVTPARDQKQCGSCYVFGTVAALECNWAIHHSGALIDSSEQHVLNCIFDGCDGGTIDEVATFLVSKGTCDESESHYIAVKQPCDSVSIKYLATARDYVDVNGGVPPIDQMKGAILTHGALAVFMYAGGFENYYGTDEVIWSNTNAGPHIVLVTGWDDTKRYPGGKGAWEIKNSWGPDWGKDGFGYVAYNVRDIGDNATWIETSRGAFAPTTIPEGRKALGQ